MNFWSTLPTGRSAGRVSLLQTVGSSSDASCLIADSSMSSCFTLNPTIPSQFSLQTVSWEFYTIPGTTRFPRIYPLASLLLSIVQRRTVRHKRSGTCIFEKAHIFFLVQPAAEDQNTLGDGDTRTSPLITVTGKSSQGDTCLDTDSPSSIVVSAVTTSIPTFPGTSGDVK